MSNKKENEIPQMSLEEFHKKEREVLMGKTDTLPSGQTIEDARKAFAEQNKAFYDEENKRQAKVDKSKNNFKIETTFGTDGLVEIVSGEKPKETKTTETAKPKEPTPPTPTT